MMTYAVKTRQINDIKISNGHVPSSSCWKAKVRCLLYAPDSLTGQRLLSMRYVLMQGLRTKVHHVTAVVH